MSLGARDARDAGIGRAVDHAERVTPAWSEIAFCALVAFIARWQVGARFTSETVRDSVEGRAVPVPPHLRAWGGVFLRAANASLIAKAGYVEATAPNCHCGTLTAWVVTG